MIVKYEPVEYGNGYDIVHNPDQFKLTLDGKTSEYVYAEGSKRIKFDVFS